MREGERGRIDVVQWEDCQKESHSEPLWNWGFTDPSAAFCSNLETFPGIAHFGENISNKVSKVKAVETSFVAGLPFFCYAFDMVHISSFKHPFRCVADENKSPHSYILKKWQVQIYIRVHWFLPQQYISDFANALWPLHQVAIQNYTFVLNRPICVVPGCNSEMCYDMLGILRNTRPVN